ncbi:metal-sulfur cluster assembly factor [Brevibacillus sp. TJ4]|uniref:metal-sulfur cluster assembly factor n=1 Tax=Brevibacillus sp. TJ4 TaxID=3234853 RepID=UPI003B9FC8F3
METVDKLWVALEDVIDPEVGVNIVDLGLVYDISLDEQQAATITMTLTIPQCPLRDEIVSSVEETAKSVSGVKEAHVNLVFDPPWKPAMMNDRAIEEIRRRRSLV